MSDSSRPRGLQPTRLLRPWDSPGKSTGVGCHCLLRNIGYVEANDTHYIVYFILLLSFHGDLSPVCLGFSSLI